MALLLQVLLFLAMVICLSKEFFTYIPNFLIIIMASHIILTTYNYNDHMQSGESKHDQSFSLSSSVTVDVGFHDSISICGTDTSEETVDLAPEVTSKGFGDMHNHFHSVDQDRAFAAEYSILQELNETNIRQQSELSKQHMKTGGGIYLTDAWLHALLPPNQIVPEDDRDGETVDAGWDLPPAKIDGFNGRITGGLEANSSQVVDIGNVSNKTILLRINDPVAVYAFPYYGKIEFRGELICTPRVVDNPTTHELNVLYTYKFELGQLMDGLTICSTSPLPKISVDYHLYTEQFPQGFPASGAHAAWWLDQLSPVYFSDAVAQLAPCARAVDLRPFNGSTFTLQPMNTLAPPEFLGLQACNDPRVGENARYKGTANWAMKVRAGNRLMKLGSMERSPMLCEVWPWNIDEGLYDGHPHQTVMPYEGYFTEQDGRQENQLRITQIDGIPIHARERFQYHKIAQAWKAAQENAVADSPSSCLDATELFMEFLPPDEFIPTYDEAAFLRNYEEHQASEWRICNHLWQNTSPTECCMCDEWDEEGDDPGKVTIMIHESGVEYDEIYGRANQMLQLWLEHIQCWSRYSEETEKFSWAGNEAFLLNTKGKNEQTHPHLLRKSGVLAEQKTPPTRSVFLADFQLVADGPIQKIRAAPVQVLPQRSYSWLHPGGNCWPV